jgi:UDP-N-acetylglucosamine 2-epimerase (non-hydrolysing)
MVRVLTVIGTRPEAIKMAPVLKELARHTRDVESFVCSVGQHRQMLDQVFDLFGIRPDHELNVMQPDQTLAGLTAQLFGALDPVVEEVRPHWVLAQGDTTTVFVAAMVAFYRRIAFGHVEAGLRTGDLQRPFPEEANRRIADLLAEAWFAPTPHARQALLAEGCDPDRVYVTGNTVIDALFDVAARDYDWASGPLAGVDRKRPLVLVTAHRRESFGRPFQELCEAIRSLACGAGRDALFIYPVHLNPNVRRPVLSLLGDLPNVQLIEPLDYAALVHLMKGATLVLTDSGGIQEEAPSLGVPVLVMRDTTERPEGLEAGLVRLVGTDRQRIVAEAAAWLQRPATAGARSRDASPYGDGKAAARIVSILLSRHAQTTARTGQEASIS